MGKGDDLVAAAIARLARGDGRGSLLNLGIDRTEVIRDAGVSTGVIYNNFSARGQGDALRGLVDEVMDRLLSEQLRQREAAAGAYDRRARFVADGAGRETVAQALHDELSRYGAVADADDLTRARERAYYLAVALCDAATTTSQLPISDADDLRPDVRFRRHLLAQQLEHREALLDAYRGFLEVANREPVHDVERIELVIGTFLEGAAVKQRIARGHGKLTERSRDPAEESIALDGDDLMDAVLRIFVAMSRPADGADLDPDVVLFGEDKPAARVTSEAQLHLDREAMYERVVTTIEDLDDTHTISHCALHTSAVRPSRTAEGEALKAAVGAFLTRGGKLRNIEKINSVAELDRTVERLAAELDDRHARTFRAVVMDSPPALSPMILGDRMALLGREADGLIVDAVAFVDDAGRKWSEDHYESLWQDDRTYTLATPNGLSDRGIGDARRRLEALER